MIDLAAYLRAVEGDMLKLNHLDCDSCKRTVRTLVRLVRELSGALVKTQHHCEVAATHSAIYSVAEKALARAEQVVKERGCARFVASTATLSPVRMNKRRPTR